MKKLLTITVLLFPALLFAQEKSLKLIKDFLYVKVSPTMFVVADATSSLEHPSNNLTPAILGAVGLKMRYAAVGYSTGYIKWEYGKKVTPKGIDLTITDFKKKMFPVITAQWHKAHFQENHTSGRSSSSSSTGEDLYSIGAGEMFRVFKTVKIMLTGGVSIWNCKISGVTTRERINYYYYDKGHYGMLFLAASLAW